MAVIKRQDVPDPVLPKETVEVEALGGEVVVRGLLLTEYLDLKASIAAAAKGSVADRSGVHAVLPVLLAITVLDADEQPVFTQQEWQVFGAKHASQAIALFNVAWELSGFNQAAAVKN
jgi:hypothetical protein